jgi:hypothetical protein
VSEIEPSYRGQVFRRTDDPADLDRAEADEEVRYVGWAEIQSLLARHGVTLAAVILIAGQVAWKASFLNQFYFRQDDLHFTELSMQYGLSWKYLSYVGSGHLHPGVLLVTWIMAKLALYNWGAATVLSLAFLVVASFACWRMLRTLIGNRPAILIPLAVYLATPLTFPDDSWWSSAVESLPLQAAIFLAVTAHVLYVRTGRYGHLIAAAWWLAVGLFFFEKAVFIPVVLFIITAGFLEPGRLIHAAWQSLKRYWRAWAVYAVLVCGYLALLLATLRQSTVKPAPASLSTSIIFSWGLITKTLLPGLLGGPWTWVQETNAAVAYSNPTVAMIWVAGCLAAAVIAASIALRYRAWRAWTILAAWVVLADVVPILLGRLATGSFRQLLSLDTRYVADAAPLAVVAVALAFWPVFQSGDRAAAQHHQERFTGSAWTRVGILVTCAIVVSSISSVVNYEKATHLANVLGRHYLSNAKAALAHQPAGTVIFDEDTPQYVMVGVYYQNYALESVALAPLASRQTARDVRWTQHPSGNIDRLLMFDTFGILRTAIVRGVGSLPHPQACLPDRRGKIAIRFGRPSPSYSGVLRLGYYAGQASAGYVLSVRYGSEVRRLMLDTGLHSAYLPVSGSASGITISVPAGIGVCVGDAQAGNLQPQPLGPIP